MVFFEVAFVFSSLLALTNGVPAPAPGPQTFYQRPLNSDCVSSIGSVVPVSSGTVTYFPRSFQIQSDSITSVNDRVKVTVAQDFSVEYFNNYKVVTNTLVNESYVLYQCGTQPPAANSLPLGAKLFSVPLTSVAVLETVPLAFLNELGVLDRVQSVSSFAVEACGQKLLSCGKVAVSSLSLNASILQSRVEPYADAAITSSNYSNAAITFAFSASSDPGVLNRAEWVKFLGVFFNMDATATEMFDEINATYAETKASIAPAAKGPVMAFVDLYTYPPDTAYEVSLAAYKLQYTQDSGAAVPNKTALLSTPNVILAPYDLTNSTVWFAWNNSAGGFKTQADATAAFQSFLKGVDVVIDETYSLNPTTYNYTTFLTNMNISSTDNYPFVTNKAVYREDGLVSAAPSYGLDWFEGAIARPDQVLLDFARASDPTAFADHTPIWIRNIAKGENVTITASQNCNQIASCSASPTPICPFVKTCSNGAVVSQQSINSTCVYVPCSS